MKTGLTSFLSCEKEYARREQNEKRTWSLSHSTNYTDTLILPAPDCRRDSPLAPERRGTIAERQYTMIAGAPYEYTSDAVIATVQADRAGIQPENRAAFRARFFAKGHPCLRCSPPVKTHGWAIHHDAEGRIALIDPTGDRFAALVADPDIAKIHGMRSARR